MFGNRYFAIYFGDRYFAPGGDAAPAPPVEPPVTEPPPATINLFGGVGGIRREMTDREREELHRRIRKSLGLDKDTEPPQPVIEVPSIAEPISTAVIRVHTAANDALDREDDEIVLLAATCW